MRGFDESQPISAKVNWVDNPVPLLGAEATEYGLLAYTPAEGGIMRWLVPWSSVEYVNQFIPDTSTPQQPTVTPPQPNGPTPLFD